MPYEKQQYIKKMNHSYLRIAIMRFPLKSGKEKEKEIRIISSIRHLLTTKANAQPFSGAVNSLCSPLSEL